LNRTQIKRDVAIITRKPPPKIGCYYPEARTGLRDIHTGASSADDLH
jgi:hypothetical protein